ncbi:MAG: hypothetical protein ACTSQA_01455 [Candidatus Heimdallarchaeaceae archaeon]
MAKYYLATIVFFLFGALLMPLSASAAYNTVHFDDDTNIVLGNGTTLIISSGADIEAVRIYSTYVEFDMLNNSSIVVTSNNRYALTNSINAGVECETSYSRISLSSSATQTVTVTPGDVCGSIGGGPTGGGGSTADTTAPSISSIEAVPSDTTAVITWTTNESSISWVVYGTSTGYGSEEKTTSYVTSHSVSLSGLTAETTYHYQVKSKDSTGNIGTYTDKTFTTLATGEEPAEEPAEEPEEPTTEPEEPSEVTIPQITFDKPISEMTVPELQDKVQEILEAISILQTLLDEMIGTVAVEGVPAEFSFENNLKLGDVSTDVKYLQIVLNSNSVTRLAESGVGSPGHETNYFGPLTKAGVIKFQEKYSEATLAPWGLTKGTGFVGSTTRDKLDELLGK